MAEIFLVASGKGGVGKSSFTVAAAKALTKLGKKVLIVDADVGLRSLDLLIEGTESVLYDWGDVICRRCEPEAAVVTVDGSTGLLTCPLKFDEAYTGQSFSEMLGSYTNGAYDFIIIDAPAGIGTVLQMACAATNKGIVISTPDRVCVRSACIAANVMRQNGVKDTRLVINRFEQKAVEKNKLLNIDKVIDGTEIRLLGVIPEDNAIQYGSIYTRRQISTPSFKRIARRMCGEEVRLFG